MPCRAMQQKSLGTLVMCLRNQQGCQQWQLHCAMIVTVCLLGPWCANKMELWSWSWLFCNTCCAMQGDAGTFKKFISLPDHSANLTNVLIERLHCRDRPAVNSPAPRSYLYATCLAESLQVLPEFVWRPSSSIQGNIWCWQGQSGSCNTW